MLSKVITNTKQTVLLQNALWQFKQTPYKFTWNSEGYWNQTLQSGSLWQICVAQLTISVKETQCFGKWIHLCHQVKSGKPTQLHSLKDVINRKLKKHIIRSCRRGIATLQCKWRLQIIQAVVSKCKVWVLQILWNKAKECSHGCSKWHTSRCSTLKSL